MSFWGSKNKSGSKPAPPKIRVERIAAAKKPTPLPSKLASRPQEIKRALHSPASSSPSSSRDSPATTPSDRYESSRLQPRKRKAQKQKTSTQQRLIESDDESDGAISSTSCEDPYKKHKVDRLIDSERKVRSQVAFSDEGGNFDMIHAAEVTSPGKKAKIVTDGNVETVTVELVYPSASQREREVKPRDFPNGKSNSVFRFHLIFGNDQINSTTEILEIARHVTDNYLTQEQKSPFLDPDSGIIRRLKRAENLLRRDNITEQNKELLDGFKGAVEIYNSALDSLIMKGNLARNLDSIHRLDEKMVHFILRQVYDRAVSPKVDLLKQYENGTDNVYGELKPSFVSEILAETKLKSSQVFVDFGSGVGNVVLQAALESGCESWGCEMMENACKLAEAQEREFAARCRLWGIEPGSVSLERGNFLENNRFHEAMRRADVILVNNQAFTPELNQRLIDLFLDAKDGCKIVSLRSFVPHGHTLSRNSNNPVNMLRVVKKHYYADRVSWTDAPGEYFIATKDSERMREFGTDDD